MKTVLFHFYFLLALSALAQPINYQGRLSDKSGTNVNGTRNFTLRIFDAKTGGKQVYEENVGAVTVSEGAYSFNFGESGKSVVTPTEMIAFADGEKQIFNYTVKSPPVLGEIKISGGDYSWTESGSSDATKFTATANKNSGAVSAIFLTGAPEAGENVSISYDHNSNGVMGALSRGGQAWLELVVGGEALSPRERLVAVPFALRAGVAESVKNKPERLLLNIDRITLDTGTTLKSGLWYAVYSPVYRDSLKIYIPKDAQKLIVRIANPMHYWDQSKDAGGKHNQLGDPTIKAFMSNSGMNRSEPEFTLLRSGKNEFQLENPASGWMQIWFHVRGKSDYPNNHFFHSKDNKIAILVR